MLQYKFIMALTDVEIRIIMWFTGGLLSLIFFFLSFYFVRSIKIQDDLSKAVKNLQITMSGMNAIILAIQDKDETFRKSCVVSHVKVDEKLKEYTEEIKELNGKIIRVETKLGL